MWVADQTAPTIANLVESELKLYSRAGFQVKEVYANCKFKPVLHILYDCGWFFTTNLANAQEHVPEAEHNNHVLKEHICTTYHGIQNKVLPRTHGNGDCSKVKLLPAKCGCLKYFSPWEILHHVKLDYKKHCAVPLRSYVFAHDKPTLTNTVCVCVLDCLSYMQFT